MHQSTFAARSADYGWVIDATKNDGQVEQLVGVYRSEYLAVRWIEDHPAAWWAAQAPRPVLGISSTGVAT
jgi:hypothetical protein